MPWNKNKIKKWKLQKIILNLMFFYSIHVYLITTLSFSLKKCFGWLIVTRYNHSVSKWNQQLYNLLGIHIFKPLREFMFLHYLYISIILKKKKKLLLEIVLMKNIQWSHLVEKYTAMIFFYQKAFCISQTNG